MSNTGSLRGTERAPLSAAFTRDRAATAIAALLFTAILVSFRPFQPAGAEMPATAATSSTSSASARLAPSRSSRCWLSPTTRGALAVQPVLAADAGLSNALGGDGNRSAVSHARRLLHADRHFDDGDDLALPRDAEAFSKVIIFTIVVVMGLSYIGLIAFPNEALHTTDSLEPEHAGLWRGVFTHKNIAGPVMACFSFAGLYLYRRGRRLWGASIFCAAMIFMLHTGSKTTAGLVPFSILIVVLPSLIGMRLGTPILFALAIITAAIGTLGIDSCRR